MLFSCPWFETRPRTERRRISFAYLTCTWRYDNRQHLLFRNCTDQWSPPGQWTSEEAHKCQHTFRNVPSWKFVGLRKHNIDCFSCQYTCSIRVSRATAHNKNRSLTLSRHKVKVQAELFQRSTRAWRAGKSACTIPLLRHLESPRPTSARHNNGLSYYLHYSQFQLLSQQKPRIVWIAVGLLWLRIKCNCRSVKNRYNQGLTVFQDQYNSSAFDGSKAFSQ